MKTSRKNLLLLTLMICFSVNAKAQEATSSSSADPFQDKIGILPMAAVEVGWASEASAADTKLSTGVSLGAEYRTFTFGDFSSHSRLLYHYYKNEASNIAMNYSVEAHAVTIGQTFNYDWQLSSMLVQPYLAAEVGIGLARTEFKVNFLGNDFSENDSSNGMFADLSVGSKFYLNDNLVPFGAFGYRSFKAGKVDVVPGAGVESEVDLSGTYATVGMAYLF